jgi:hypothetical protein
MAFSMTERIDWHFLGSRLRAIDFHFLWMVAAPESEWLWSYIGVDGGDVLLTGDATRDDFATAAKFVDQSLQFAPMRACDKATLASQARRVGQIFASIEREGFAIRHQINGRKCDTTIRLPIRGRGR